MSDFKGRHFRGEIVLWAVRWYCRYPISYRDLEAMMTERGVAVDHSTIYRWVQRFAPEMEKRLRWQWRRPQSRSWRVDETYIKVRGKWAYLYRAVDKLGNTIDFYLSATRNTTAAKRFLGKALRGLKEWEQPEVLNTDKAPAYAAAIAELKAEGKCPKDTRHRQVKYLNNVIEADHGKLKLLIRPVRGFKTLKTAYATIKGFEVMRALRKGQAGMFALQGGIVGEARIVERAFALGPCALTEAMALLQDRLANAETWRKHGCRPDLTHPYVRFATEPDVLDPVVARYRNKTLRRYFRGDAAFASPEVYEFLEAEGFKYAIRLPANKVLHDSIAHLLKRPVGRPPKEVRRYYANFSYRAGSWTEPRRVVAKVEWHSGELYPRVGLDRFHRSSVTNLSRPAERVVAFYNQRGTAEQWIKEGKNAIKWTRLSCRSLRNNAVRLQLHALAYNLGNFMRTLALPDAVEQWSLTTLREKLVKIGAKVVSHGRYVTFQLAEVAVTRSLFQKILSLIDDLRRRPAPA